jgi:hypothetical protein
VKLLLDDEFFLIILQDYFKIFMGLPTTGGAPPKAEKA